MVFLGFSKQILAMSLKKTTLSCAGKHDVVGAQIGAIVSVAAGAKYFGGRFDRTPLSKTENTNM